MLDMNEDNKRRFEDSMVGKVSKLWPVICGIVGVVYALVTSYNTTLLHSQRITQIGAQLDSVDTRLYIVEKEQAIRGTQFTTILERLGKMEDKIDKLAARK